MVWIGLAWTIGGATGWSTAKKFLINYLPDDSWTYWAIGIALGWAIGGSVLGWQLLQNTNAKVINSPTRNASILSDSQKALFLVSPLGRSILGVTVGLILGILFGVVYGIINDIPYDFAYAYLNIDEGFPHSPLLVVCGLAGLIAYPHRGTVWLMIGSFIVVVIAQSLQGHPPYELISYGGGYGLPAGALLSRILYWLKVIK